MANRSSRLCHNGRAYAACSVGEGEAEPPPQANHGPIEGLPPRWCRRCRDSYHDAVTHSRVAGLLGYQGRSAPSAQTAGALASYLAIPSSASPFGAWLQQPPIVQMAAVAERARQRAARRASKLELQSRSARLLP